MVWLNVEVIDGPKQITGKIAKLRLQSHAEGDPDMMSSEWWISRTIGRMDLFKMFGDFDGLDKISREHIHIRETDYFPFHRTGFEVYDQRSNNGTTFPDGKGNLVRLADVITIKLSYCNDDFTIPPTDYIVPIGDRAEMQESLAVAWVDVTVISGPSSLIGKSGQVPIHYNREVIFSELCVGQTHTWHYIGCDDFRLMFGEFEGIEKIAKAHVEIHLLYPFQVTNEFIVSGNTSQLRYWETPHTDVSFPNIKNSGTSVDVDVARVIIVRLSISDNAN